ncbi:MAG: putative transcriptional regulator [Bacteroidia bacterium]|jgi:predicted transcriptional regulator
MLTKEKIQKQLDEMPDEFSLDELIDRLIVIDKIQEGLKDSLEGRTISNDDMKKEIDSWFK